MSGVYKGITGISYEDFVAEHLERVSKGSYYEHDYALRKFGEVCEPKDLTVIDYSMIEAFVKCREAEGVSPYTLNKNLRSLQSAFGKAVKRGYIKVCPINKDNRRDLFVSEPETNPVVLSDAEFKTVLAACPDDTWRTMCKIACHTGLRRNEVVFLKWDQVDFENEVLTVCNVEDHRTKSGKIRTVPMNQEIIDALTEAMLLAPEKNPFVFRCNMTEHNFSHRLARIVIDAGYYTVDDKGKKHNKFSFHDLRRTFGTNLANKGISPKVLQELMGHAKLETTMKYYVNANMEQKKQAVAMLAAQTA
jgi:integrase